MVTALPAYFLPHRVRVRAFRGSGSLGPVFDPPVEVPAFADDERKLVRSRTGQEVVSSSSVVVDFGRDVPEGSLVTVWPGTVGEREARVIATGRHAHATLPSYQTLDLE